MSLEKLGEIYKNIDNYEKLSISLDGKISRMEDEKREQEAVKHLMNFEMTKVTSNLEKLRKEVGELELEYERSIKNYHNWNKLHNEFSRNQKSMLLLREIEETSKSKRRRALRKMGITEDKNTDKFY